MSRVLASPVPTVTAAPAAPRLQPRVVGTALALLGLGGTGLATAYGPRQGALFLVGAACGLVLHHAAFGFTAANRALVLAGDARGLRAQLLMLAAATVLFAPVLGGMVGELEVVGAVAPVGVAVVVGAFVFGAGMQLAGGCGSGTLYHLGAGTPAMALVLAAFVAGSVLATVHAPVWEALPALEPVVLGERLGWPAAVATQLAVCAALAIALRGLERRRGVGARSGAGAAPVAARLLHGPWPLAAGALALAGLNLATLLLAGHPWGITWAFALWGAKGLVALGWDLSTVPFWQGDFQRAALARPVLADVTTVMDLGLVLGALLGAGLAGRFAPRRRLPLRRAVAAVLGGLLLGYGARLAYGCNIGAFFSGVASTSLHGWVWGVAALLGTPVGLALRRALGLDGGSPRAPGR